MSDSPKRRRSVALPPGRASFREAAARLGLSVVTLRRRIRPIGDVATRQLWAARLELKRRDRGRSIPVYHVCRRRLAEWAPEIGGEDRPVED